MITKGRIVSTLILAAVLFVFGAVYKFYFEEKLLTYNNNEKLKDQLQATYDEMETGFSGVQPAILTSEWRRMVQPWRDAINERTVFFNLADWSDHEKYAEGGPMLKFWYDTTVNKMVWDLYQEVGTKMRGYAGWYINPQTEFATPASAYWTGVEFTKKEAYPELEKLSFGISACQMLMDAKASSISGVRVWPKRNDKDAGPMLDVRTLGLSFTMNMRDLVQFLDRHRKSDRYFNVDAMRITYPQIGWPQEPQLNVEMLLSQAIYTEARARTASAGGAAGAAGPPGFGGMGGRPGMRGGRPGGPRGIFNQRGMGRGGVGTPPPQPGVFGRAWKWIKRNIFYTN